MISAVSDNFMESETMSTTSESSFENEGGRNRGRAEAEKKMMKLRSIKLSRRGRSSSRTQFHTMLSGYAASSEQSTPIEMSDESSNHVNPASSADTKEEDFQVLSSFKPVKSVTRKSSMKFRRSQLRKSSGGNDLKKSRSIKPASFESSNDSSEQDKKILTNGDKPVRVIRISTLGPMRILTKMASLKSKRPSTKKCSETSSLSDQTVERATCSSILKDSKFPDHVEIKPGGGESDATALLNVCRYSYCSLHGHHHTNKPPLKRFVSMRRRVAKTQKSSKPDHQSSGNRKNGKRVAVKQTTVDITEIYSDHDVNEEIASSLNLEERKDLETVSTQGSCEPPYSLFPSASVTRTKEERSSASEEKNEDFRSADFMADSTTDVENQKNFTFWKFIYKHMVAGIDAEFETQKSFPRVNSEENVENLNNAHEKNESCQEISRTDQDKTIEYHEASNRKLEFSQSDAIKLVQQAFDKILSEIPDHSSDDQSIASDETSDQDFLLKKQDEGKEVSIPTSSNSTEDCLVQDREQIQVQTDNKVPSEQVKAAQMQPKRSDKQMPNSWSNLKKVIILKRFVKSLEKVRNLKPRTIRYFPANKDAEAERIHLRHQNMQGRKNSEEWMIDHALRQVISTLAPSQKRKVAMLVQAFETVIPVPENGNDMRSNAAASSPKTSDQAYKRGQQIPETSPEPKERNLLCGSREQPLCMAASEMSSTDMMKKEDTGAVDYNNGEEVSTLMDGKPKLVDLSLSEIEEPGLSGKPVNNEDAARTSHEKPTVNEEVIQRISEEEVFILDSEVCNGGAEFNITKMDLESSDLINSADESLSKPEIPTEVGEGARPKYKFLSSRTREHSESNFAAHVSKLERQKYTRLWYLIYKHMVSGSTTENGSQPLQKEADEECEDSSAAGQTMMENHTTGSQRIECHNNEIIKLVEEAIDEIPLPEVQDETPENQSVTGDSILDQQLLEKKHGEEEVKLISSSTASAKENCGEAKNVTAELSSTFDFEEKIVMPENVSTQNEAKGEPEGANKSKKRVQRNWSNLKKLVLIRRFVKALEKVREFNPQGPQYLPLDPAPESEKVLLRHQNMEDRKNAEEWMLDYALQQVVAKLTPERKRRVHLLVEAFETVIPTIS